MKVTLRRYTDKPVEAIELAASNCYDSDIANSNGRIMNSCIKSGHMSVTEFAQFHFHIEGISRACSHQLVRHRTGKFAQRSQRYIEESGFDYVMPNRFVGTELEDTFNRYMNMISDMYDILIYMGAEKEDARAVLPNACTTTIDVSFDLRNLMSFMNERLCSKAQKEIRELAIQMKKCVEEVAPELAKLFVPKCESYPIPCCPEKVGCGRKPMVKDM